MLPKPFSYDFNFFLSTVCVRYTSVLTAFFSLALATNEDGNELLLETAFLRRSYRIFMLLFLLLILLARSIALFFHMTSSSSSSSPSPPESGARDSFTINELARFQMPCIYCFWMTYCCLCEGGDGSGDGDGDRGRGGGKTNEKRNISKNVSFTLFLFSFLSHLALCACVFSLITVNLSDF